MRVGRDRVKASFQPGDSEANLLLGAPGTRPEVGFQVIPPHPHRPLKALDNKGKHPEKGELLFLPLQPQPCSHIEADLMTLAKLSRPKDLASSDFLGPVLWRQTELPGLGGVSFLPLWVALVNLWGPQ